MKDAEFMTWWELIVLVLCDQNKPLTAKQIFAEIGKHAPKKCKAKSSVSATLSIHRDKLICEHNGTANTYKMVTYDFI